MPAKDTCENLLDLLYCDYEKSIDVSLKFEHSKLTYQKFFITLVTTIGTISIGFLKLRIFESSNSIATIEVLIGLLLLFSSLLGYIIVRNLVSIRRQCIYYNNAIIYLRKQLIDRLSLSHEYPSLKEVPANHHHSADYITILLCSCINFIMITCGISLIFDILNLKPIAYGFVFGLITLSYFIVYYITIEKVLRTKL